MSLEIDVVIRTGDQKIVSGGLSEDEAIEFIQRISYENDARLDHMTGGGDE